MFRWTGITLLLVMVAGASVRAQIPVIDPENLAQAILIAERTWQHYQQLRQQYETIVRMASGLGSMDRFRVPAIQITRHDPTFWEYGRPVDRRPEQRRSIRCSLRGHHLAAPAAD